MYIVYLTYNHINEKKYIGVHKQKSGYSSDQFDGYLGSGIALKMAIKKYGKENFTRETLLSSEDRDEIYRMEEELVTLDSNSYNMKKGGIGGFDYINQNKIRPDYEQLLAKTRKTLIEKYGVDNPGKLESSKRKLIERNKLPKKQSTIKKQSESLRSSGKVKGKNNGMFGKLGELAPAFGRTGSLHPMHGVHHSSDTIDKLKNNQNLKRSKERTVCPHCKKEGGRPVMLRFHFDNCKSKSMEI